VRSLLARAAAGRGARAAREALLTALRVTCQQPSDLFDRLLASARETGVRISAHSSAIAAFELANAAARRDAARVERLLRALDATPALRASYPLGLTALRAAAAVGLAPRVGAEFERLLALPRRADARLFQQAIHAACAVGDRSLALRALREAAARRAPFGRDAALSLARRLREAGAAGADSQLELVRAAAAVGGRTLTPALLAESVAALAEAGADAAVVAACDVAAAAGVAPPPAAHAMLVQSLLRLGDTARAVDAVVAAAAARRCAPASVCAVLDHLLDAPADPAAWAAGARVWAAWRRVRATLPPASPAASAATALLVQLAATHSRWPAALAAVGELRASQPTTRAVALALARGARELSPKGSPLRVWAASAFSDGIGDDAALAEVLTLRSAAPLHAPLAPRPLAAWAALEAKLLRRLMQLGLVSPRAIAALPPASPPPPPEEAAP
jgi:hypothetical protein